MHVIHFLQMPDEHETKAVELYFLVFCMKNANKYNTILKIFCLTIMYV